MATCLMDAGSNLGSATLSIHVTSEKELDGDVITLTGYVHRPVEYSYGKYGHSTMHAVCQPLDTSIFRALSRHRAALPRGAPGFRFTQCVYSMISIFSLQSQKLANLCYQSVATSCIEYRCAYNSWHAFLIHEFYHVCTLIHGHIVEPAEHLAVEPATCWLSRWEWRLYRPGVANTTQDLLSHPDNQK